MKQHKLTLSFVLIIAIFLSFGIITINALFNLGKLTRTIYDHPLVVSNASLTAALNITKMHRGMKDVVLSRSMKEVEADQKAVQLAETQVYLQLDLIRERILGEKGQRLESETRELFVQWKPIREEVFELLEAGKKDDAIHITRHEGAEHVAKLEGKMLELSSYARNKATTFIKSAESGQAKLERATILLTSVGVLFSIVIAVYTSYTVIKSERLLMAQRDELQHALDEIDTLRGIIPICSHCKQIRDDEGSWNQLEAYIRDHSQADFSHGICPSCLEKHYPEEFAIIQNDLNGKTE